jgi:hypothetical protein
VKLHAFRQSEEESSFFEKKEPKKHLFSGHGLDLSRPWPENKSLLLLFFRKEGLSFFLLPALPVLLGKARHRWIFP